MKDQSSSHEFLTMSQKEGRGPLDSNSSKFNVMLYRMGIAKVKVEDWIILQRSRFDITVEGEPYSALQLYFNSQNGDYIIRVWGKTQSTGNILNNMREFELLCNKIFVQGLACCPGQIGNDASDDESFVSVDYPFQRRMSPDCAIVHLPQDPDSDNVPIDLCPQCSSDTKANMEVKYEAPDTYVSLLKDPLTFHPKTEMKETTLWDRDHINESHSEFDNVSNCKRGESTSYVGTKLNDPLTNDNQIVWEETKKKNTKKQAQNKPKEIPLEPHEDRKIECEYCGTTISEDGETISLDLHYKECSVALEGARQQMLSLIYSEPKEPKEQKKVNPEAPVVCHICGKEGTQKSMHQHMHRHKMEKDPLRCPYSRCGTLFTSEEETRLHVANSHLRRQQLFCEICGFLCKSKGQLRTHVQVVHKKMSLDIKCTECDKIFINHSAMSRHRYVVHFPDKFKCNVCKKSFGTSGQLRRHEEVHSGERGFQCDECGRKLRKKEDLDDHKRIHTGEKPFACQHCPYKGSSKSLLYHHMKQKHKGEFEDERKKKEEAKIKISTEVLTSKTDGGELC